MSVALDDIRGTCLEFQIEENGFNSAQKLLQGQDGDLNLSLKHIRNVGSRILGESLPEAYQTPPPEAEQLGSVSFLGGGSEGLGLYAGLVGGNSEAAVSALQDQVDLLSAPMCHEADVIFSAHGCRRDPGGAENSRSVVAGPCSPLFSAQVWGSAPSMKGGTVDLGLAARGCQQGFVAGIADPVVEPLIANDSSEKIVPTQCTVGLGEEENGPEMVAVNVVEMAADDITRLQEENRQLLAWREAVLAVREVLQDADSAADGKDGDDPVARHARWTSCPALGALLPRLQQRLQLLLSDLAAACTRERSLAGTGNQPIAVDQRSSCPFVDVEVKVDRSAGSGSISCNCPGVVEDVMEAKRKMLSGEDIERSRAYAGEDAKLMESMRAESETLRVVARILRKKEQESQERITILEREVLEASIAAAKQDLLVLKLRKQLSGKATATKSEEQYHQASVTPSRRPAPRPQGPSSCVNGGPTRNLARGLQEQKTDHAEVEMVDARTLRVGQAPEREEDYESYPGEGPSPSKADDHTQHRAQEKYFPKDSCCSFEQGPPSGCSRDGMPHRLSSLSAEPDASAGTPLLTQQGSVRSGAPGSTARGLFDGEVEREAGPRVSQGDESGVRRCPRTPTTDILRRVLYDRSSTPQARDERSELGVSAAKASPGGLRRRLFTEDRADHARTVVCVPRDDSSGLACDISIDSDVSCL